ncbi:MAG: hypothetical protein ACT4OX_17230 [Actinomycetota bacterium]
MGTAADFNLARAAEVTDGYINIDMARAAGLSRTQIRHRCAEIWNPVHEGVYRLPGVPKSWTGELRAACWAAGDGAAVSHRSAAAAYEVPGRRTDVIEITCRRWDRARHPGLVVHEQRRFPDRDITELDGIPIVTPELLLLQLAWWKPSVNYVEAVIHALRRKRLISYESSHATFIRHARRGLKGVAAVRTALERWDPSQRATESEKETLLLQILRRHGVPEPVVQFEVYDQNGLFVARTEFGIREWKITIDYDSMQEHLDEFQIARDNRRRNRIMGAGYWPLVARIGDLRNGGGELVDEIFNVARQRGELA